MADNGLVKFAMVGGIGFLAYRYFFMTPAAAPAPAADTTAAGSSTSTTKAADTYNFNSLASLFGRMADASKSVTAQSPDAWNALAIQQGGPNPMPDPVPIFGGRPDMTLAQYWAGVSAWLATNKGMKGLGVYAGLGALAFGGRR